MNIIYIQRISHVYKKISIKETNTFFFFLFSEYQGQLEVPSDCHNLHISADYSLVQSCSVGRDPLRVICISDPYFYHHVFLSHSHIIQAHSHGSTKCGGFPKTDILQKCQFETFVLNHKNCDFKNIYIYYIIDKTIY